MANVPSLLEFWDTVPPARQVLPSDEIDRLPEPARRYLGHAIAEGRPLAQAVRLRMHGEIKLNRWLPFRAEQVIRRDRGMIWRARARVSGLPVSGYDRLIDGQAAMRWRLLGVLQVMRADGPDVTRSAAGRMMCESIWLPSILCAPDVEWSATDDNRVAARLTIPPETADLHLDVTSAGALRSVHLKRWGNPGERSFDYLPFGGLVEEEAAFDGYTIPVRVRVGWHFGSDRFDEDGEFFRATIDRARFR